MTLLNCAIDTGYGCALGKSSLKEVKINNFITEIVTKRDALESASSIKKLDENNIILKYNNKYYTVGNFTHKYSLTCTRNLTTDRIGDELHLIELLSTLGLLTDLTEFNVNLMVGLPIKISEKYSTFIEWLKRTYTFSYLTAKGEIEKTIHIQNVDCILQPIAPIFTLYPKLQTQNIISLDIGHGTTDMIFMSNGSLIRETGARISADGMQYCYKRLKELLINEYEDSKYKLKNVSEKQLEFAIEIGTFKMNGEQIDIEKLLHKTFDSYAQYLFSIIETNYSNFLSQADIILVSGGVFNNDYFRHLLQDKFIKLNDINFKIHKRPQWAIVLGMFNYINRYHPEFRGQDEYYNSNTVQDIFID